MNKKQANKLYKRMKNKMNKELIGTILFILSTSIGVPFSIVGLSMLILKEYYPFSLIILILGISLIFISYKSYKEFAVDKKQE